MSIKRITDFMNEKKGIVSEGVFIHSREDIIADQKSWDDEDPRKFDDFSTNPYWITTGDGQDPLGIADDADLNEIMSTTVILVQYAVDYWDIDNMTGKYVYFKGSPIGEVPPGMSEEDISRRLAVLPEGLCVVVNYESFLG